MISHSVEKLCVRLYVYTCASHSKNAQSLLTDVWFPYIESSSKYFKTVIINVFISCVPCSFPTQTGKSRKRGRYFPVREF